MIESGFGPMACECIVCADASLTVRIFDRATGRVDLMVSGIGVDKLRTGQDVFRLISELRDELSSVSMRPSERAPSSEA